MARPPLAALLALCLPAFALAQDWAAPAAELKFKKASKTGAPAEAPPVMSGNVDMSDFLARLEDLTLDTTELRGLLGRVGVSFRPPTASANAQYSRAYNHLYLPDTFKAKGRDAVRYDLASNELSTVIHELTHASADLLTSGAAGSPGREHYDALGMIKTQVRGGAWWSYYPASKADELAGYYMGCAIADVAFAADNLAVYNSGLGLGGTMAPDEAEANRLGATVLLFDQAPQGAKVRPAPESWLLLQRRGLGQCDVAGEAQFEGKPIGVEPDFGVKGQLFQNALGLKPPLSVKELADRLNDPARSSPGIEVLRKKIREARLKSARAAK